MNQYFENNFQNTNSYIINYSINEVHLYSDKCLKQNKNYSLLIIYLLYLLENVFKKLSTFS